MSAELAIQFVKAAVYIANNKVTSMLVDGKFFDGGMILMHKGIVSPGLSLASIALFVLVAKVFKTRLRKRLKQILTISLFAVLLGVFIVAPAQARVFKCTDESGVVRFQDRHCPGAELIIDRPAADKTNKHFIWQASAGKGTLFLLGSIHFGTPQMYPLPKVMTSSFEKSDTLVVEADIGNVDQLQLAQLIASKAMYQDGSNLRQHLSAKIWHKLEQVAQSMAVPVELLNMQKPWFVSMTLTALALKQLGFSEERGIDAHFLRLAQGKKKIVELEGLAWQLSLFDRLTVAEQVMMLEESLRELGEGKAFFDKMLRHWRAGDAQGIQRLFDEGLMAEARGARLNQIIMLDRNKSMAEKLHRLAEKGGRYFVVIGAGHLPGRQGIVALLRQQGYQVDQF